MRPVLPTGPSLDGDSALLRVSKLSVTYGAADQQAAPALRGVSFDIAKREIVGVLGESGCGKSTLALSLLGLLPSEACVTGEIVFCGHNLLQLHPAGWRSIRGAKISLIHQRAMALPALPQLRASAVVLFRVGFRGRDPPARALGHCPCSRTTRPESSDLLRTDEGGQVTT